MLLHGAVEPPQDLDGVLHGSRIKQAGAKDGFAETRHFAVFENRFQPAPVKRGNLEPDGVGSYIYCGKSRHEFVGLGPGYGSARLKKLSYSLCFSRL